VISVTDALGRTIEFEELPTRIAIVGKAGFMPLDAAFLFPKLLTASLIRAPFTDWFGFHQHCLSQVKNNDCFRY
jgi:ABC-type Fe3+-hydroxamate transport system substrate-binding protein